MNAALITDLVEDAVGGLRQLVDDESGLADDAEPTPEQAAEYVRAVRTALTDFAAAFQARVDSLTDDEILAI